MISKEDIAFVESCLDKHFSKFDPDTLKHPKVPLDMVVGEPDNEGWVTWKAIPSTLTEVDINRMEKSLQVNFPPLFRAFLTTRFFVDLSLRNKEYNLIIPAMPSEKPLEELEFTIKSWYPLISCRCLPFGDFNDGWGPVCFDTQTIECENDFAIVWFDHEEIFNLKETEFDRENLQTLARPLFDSFRSMMKEMFLKL